MTSTTGYNHLFWHEFRSLPKRQCWHKNTFGDSFVPKVNDKHPVPHRKTSTA